MDDKSFAGKNTTTTIIASAVTHNFGSTVLKAFLHKYTAGLYFMVSRKNRVRK